MIRYFGETEKEEQTRQLGRAIVDAIGFPGAAGCGPSHTVRIDSEAWHGHFVCDLDPDDWENIADSHVTRQLRKFLDLADSLQSHFGSSDTGGFTWLEVLYRILPNAGKATVPCPEQPTLLYPGKSTKVVWLRNEVFLSSATAIELLSKGLPNESAPASHGADNHRLSGAEENIIDVIRAAGHRITGKEVLAELRKRHGAASEGTTKVTLASLVRRVLLTNRQDVIPKGYGLPEWD